MRWHVCALVTLVACSKPGGLIIAVEPTSGVAMVRVYVGTTQLDRPDHFDPPGASEHAPGLALFVRDPDNTNETDVAPLGSSEIRFELQHGDGDTLPAAIVIGYDGSGTDAKPVAADVLTDLAVPDDEVDIYTAQLQPATTLGDGSPMQVEVWSPAATTPALDADCAGIAVAGNNGTKKTFIVTGNDTDCDGFTNDDPTECDPFAYDATVVTSDTCVTLDANECRLGGPTCVDGTGTTAANQCVETQECMPAPACGCTGTDPLGCLIASPTTYPGYKCMVGTTSDASNACAFDLALAPNGGLSCSDAEIELAGGGFSDQIDLFGVTYTLAVDDNSCALTFTAMASAMTTAPQDTGAVIEIELSNGHSLVLPVDFGFMGATCASSSCDLADPSDVFSPPLTECLAGWATPTKFPFPQADNGLGFSPTMPTAMDEIFYLDPAGANVMTSTLVAGNWTTSAVATGLDSATIATGFASISISGDGLTLYAVDGTAHTLVAYVRNQVGAAWQPAAMTSNLTNILWFAPNGDATDAIVQDSLDTNLSETTFASLVWSVPAEVEMAAATPFLSTDALHLYYAQDSGGTYLVFVASRRTTAEPFGTPVSQPELGAAMKPQGPWVSADGRTMVLSIATGTGMPAIFRTTR